jgi:integrase
MKASTSIILDTRKQKKDGTYPVKLRVTYNRQQKYYPTKYSLTKDDFEKARSSKPRGDFKDMALHLHAVETKAINVIDSLPFFSWQMFDKQYITKLTGTASLSEVFDTYATQLRQEGRIGTAISYECAKRSLESFSAKLKFVDVTPELLRKYEKWMIGNHNSITTVGIYLRSLRTLFNLLIEEGVLSKDFYPFGKRKYEIPIANNVKKALAMEEIHAIFRYCNPENSNRELYRDYWTFMYLCYGINVKDMSLLKYSNIREGMIVFERAKTARTKRTIEPIRVPVTDDLQAIIDKRGNIKHSEHNFIFPILSHGLSPERERQLIQQLTHVINDHMKAIAEDLGIRKPVTTYAARHSFATVLQRSGVGIDFISEALGHSSTNTTRNYLAGFEDKNRLEAVKALTAFNTDERA